LRLLTFRVFSLDLNWHQSTMTLSNNWIRVAAQRRYDSGRLWTPWIGELLLRLKVTEDVVIASEAKQSRTSAKELDCLVAEFIIGPAEGPDPFGSSP
jgi:hypothetical protein